ncbi:MAG: AAA family ATPase, partial [Tannerella sp.]|nr:AAA family ATPase [Tannerella sp.]
MDIEVRKMPVGVQNFEKLRRGGYVYVDKTRYVYELACLDRPYFLGRPRRFGKSVFLSTLKAYFEGKKELFDGLAIAELEKEWKKYPVIYIDFNREGYIDINSLKSVLDYNLQQSEEIWGRNESEMATLSTRFAGLIKRAAEKAHERVVVLIDEYDKALISTLDNVALNDEMRTILKGFFGVLKAEDEHLRFVLLTGVTKFSKVSIFSDLNQLIDISFDSRYSGVCGISEAELLQNFQPEIQVLGDANGLTYDEAFAAMKKRYDGYHFARESEDMYNPYSVL